MNCNENGMHGTKGSSTEVHKSFQYINADGGENLKRILAKLDCIKCNEINLFA